MWRLQTVSILVLFLAAAHSRAGIVVDHPPLNTGGGASDTAFDDGFVPWQRVADDILLGSAANIRRISFWGFYNADNPPATETMRVRFYGDNTGLPDDNNILFEESFFNPSRIATGRTVFTGINPDEYVYQVDLSAPLSLAANTTFWLEIVQIGDASTHFRWEISQADQNGQAFINPITGNWRETFPDLTADTAFQLSTIPEPTTIALFVLGWLLLEKRRGRREE